MLELVVVSSRTQSDTERSVKVVKQVMNDRYRGKHDEQKAAGSGDSANGGGGGGEEPGDAADGGGGGGEVRCE